MLRHIQLFLILASMLSTSPSRGEASEKPQHKMIDNSTDYRQVSLAFRWLDIMQECAAREVDKNGPRPTVLSRMMAIWATSMYDAWAAYDEKAVGTRLGNRLRRPKGEHTLQNKMKAISYASYYSLLFIFPDSSEFLTEQMKKIGYDPSMKSSDRTTPEGIGQVVVQEIINYRKNDGANQTGEEVGGNGKPYADYTFYRPVNSVDSIIDPDHWQPITFTLKDGKKVTPGFLTPHWYRVKPFALENSAQFRPGPPPTTQKDDAKLRAEADQILNFNTNLTNEQKAVVEFMRDGPRSTGQSGHWLRFAQDVSRRDHNSLDQDIKLYFSVANVAFDAFISCWETKRFYDSSRPWTLIRHYYKNKKIKGWAGPSGGVKEMSAEEWQPYSPMSFITPPFPGYTSGHATVSGAAAKIIELFTGSDKYGFVEKRKHSELTETDSGSVVTIDLPTWSGVAEMAALSRALGGYHIPSDNNVGLKVGRELAVWSWPKYQAYFEGLAEVRP